MADTSAIVDAIRLAGAMVGGGLPSAAAPSAPPSATASRQPDHRGVARQPEMRTRAGQYMFLTVGLVEAMYFINLLFTVVLRLRLQEAVVRRSARPHSRTR